MKRLAILIGVVGMCAAFLMPSDLSAQTSTQSTAEKAYQDAASTYRVAVMQIFKRHMLALDIASNENSPLRYNLVIHARALRETARLLEDVPVPEIKPNDKSKFSFEDQRDFLELVSKGIDFADEVYISARIIRFKGRGRFDKALLQMKSICRECHRSFRDPYRKLQQ